ncbi:MAG: hypothetical protein ACYDER_06350 [Ktedonobacteraceae bacterium]
MEVMQTSEVLRRQGFSQEEIDQLSELRQTIWTRQMQQDKIERRRLEFVRWLVATGRITDQIA